MQKEHSNFKTSTFPITVTCGTLEQLLLIILYITMGSRITTSSAIKIKLADQNVVSPDLANFSALKIPVKHISKQDADYSMLQWAQRHFKTSDTELEKSCSVGQQSNDRQVHYSLIAMGQVMAKP
jgi:hypothetical protein